jgi:outer membrane receptor protein involved in Fe transport
MNHTHDVRPRFSALSSAIADSLQTALAPARRPHATGVKSVVISASSGIIVTSALAVGLPAVVAAQETAVPAIEEVTVTGSRIRREDFTANAPVVSIDEAMFDETSAIGVETVLNRLPQFTPAVTQFTTADVQQTATNTVGVSTVSLRGLGPNRNLVLINGRRGMPVDPTMVIDTNSIPASAISRVEIISGGASSVYGADAVGGVVNFILKDDFEGASVDLRVGDTEHGGNEEITFSALLGANLADDRGNVMIGVERATRSLQRQWERDWRLADFADPSAPGGIFEWGSTPWIRNEVNFSSPVPNVNTNLPVQSQAALNAWRAADPTRAGKGTCVDCIFDQLPPGTIPNNVNAVNYRTNDDGTIFTGMGFAQDGPTMAPGGYRFNGPLYDPNIPGSGGNHQGEFAGLPVFVRAPNGYIKENNLYAWASSPLERLSTFGSGHFDVSDNVRVTAQAYVTRTQTESSLGATAANINQWAAAVPFGDQLYRGNNTPLYPGAAPDRSIYDIPDSLVDVNGNGVADLGIDRTNAAYTINGRFGVECDAPATAAMPWLDGLPGCTMSEAWPTTPEIYNLFLTRPDPNQIIWGNRSPDYLRTVVGNGRSTTNTTTTLNFAVGLEGDLPSGNDFWDVNLSTGRSDNVVNQLGSVRLSSLRALYLVPNYGRNAIFDPNPTHSGFAESTPTCTSGLPIMQRFVPSEDCAQIIAPSLKNEREMTQTILEANITGDLAEMASGPLQYALGFAYRENSFNFVPDNLSDNANFLDPIAGTYPNEPSFGEFDVSELYGELIVPIVADGPAIASHFNVELGGRLSDWSMENMPTLETYKALIDWGIGEEGRYRMRGGFNRAFRAPNLGELFIARTQIFGGIGTRDHCSQNLQADLGYGASSPDPVQRTQSYNICRALMGTTGSFEYYDNRALAQQPTVGNTGVSNSFGNPNLREEQADTFTLGMVMDFHDNFTLTVDWYEIEIKDMIALENADAIYQRCLSLSFNPTADPNIEPCVLVNRDPANGAPANVDRTFTNQGRALMSGVDVQLDWRRDLWGGQFGMNTVANWGIESITQERPDLAPVENAGYNSCSLQIQCQRYEYRLFTTFNYFKGAWNASLRHQYWPELEDNSCRINPNADACRYSTYPDQQLLSATFGYTFDDKYRLNFGIENLLDQDPPCVGAEPNRVPYAYTCEHASQVAGDLYNATFDQLGRRYFVSMTMDF